MPHVVLVLSTYLILSLFLGEENGERRQRTGGDQDYRRGGWRGEAKVSA